MELGALNERERVTLRQTLFSTQCDKHELVENDHIVIFLEFLFLKEIPSHAVEIKVPSVNMVINQHPDSFYYFTQQSDL